MAMRRANIQMTTTVNREKLLATLRENRGKHAAIVQEARDGYIAKAAAALTERLEQLRQGEIVSLHFMLNPPADYTEVYDNSIAMLEWNTHDAVELEADEFSQLVRDEWDWSDQFYLGNSEYSAGAASFQKVRKK